MGRCLLQFGQSLHVAVLNTYSAETQCLTHSVQLSNRVVLPSPLLDKLSQLLAGTDPCLQVLQQHLKSWVTVSLYQAQREHATPIIIELLCHAY